MIVIRLFIQTVALAIGQIRANKFRAILTTLGILIGVASVLAVVAAMNGMKRSVLAEFETFGANKMFIWGRVPPSKWPGMSWDSVRITPEEADAIREHADSIDKLTRMAHSSYNVQYGEEEFNGVPVQGIDPEWHDIEQRFVITGRPFSTIDVSERRQVCLVNDKAIEEMNLPRDPSGEHIMLGNRRFLIVGVVETVEQSAMFGGGDLRSEVFTPFTTAVKMNRWAWVDLRAQLLSPDLADDARAEVTFVLRNMRGLSPLDEDTFQIEVMQEHINNFKAMAGAMTAVAGGIVSVSLLVGGIGIMNIMLVSVSERTREIGLRKAVGARPSIVLMQFLVEAVALCILGGIIGLVIGQAMTLGLQAMPNANLEHARIPAWAIFMAIGFSGATGVIFGMFPAAKAARLNPIQALRHD